MTGLIGKAYRCCFQNGCFQQIWKTNVFGGTILSKILPQDQLDCLKLYDSRMPRGIGHV